MLSKFYRLRLKFERKNDLSRFDNKIKADFAFEVSSEGEYEQIAVLLQRCLEEEKIVQLLICSQSVEDRCLKLQEKYPEQLDLRRVELVRPWWERQFLSTWLSAPILIFCRYDFFPELMMLPQQKILLWATVKNIKRYTLKYLYYHKCYQRFASIYTPSLNQKRWINKIMGITEEGVRIGDFRVVSINQRLKKSHEIQKFQVLKKIISITENSGMKFIFGSFWQNEVLIFKSKKLRDLLNTKDLFILVVPHIVEKQNLFLIREQLEQLLERQVQIIDNSTQEVKSNICILNMKGVLCELYQYFDAAYVAGGFGRSIHSLLEPYLANCPVVCGPKVMRSTEFDTISQLDPQSVIVSTDYADVVESFFKLKKIKNKQTLVEQSYQSYQQLCGELFS